uniref:Uncharacterized protein n=1 Tax=Rhizophagus irregularis (strain DAOM 181602 / DAOM 197198 / MUCL 43194) TaxID=747089 RepID=U9UEM1_RHIID
MIHREEHDSTMYLYLRLMLRCDTVSAVGVALASASAAVSHQQSVPHQQMALQLTIEFVMAFRAQRKVKLFRKVYVISIIFTLHLIAKSYMEEFQ